MKNVILVCQILISFFLVIVILLQSKGSGLSTVFGGSEGFYRSKRGVEKLLVYLTILLVVLFFVFSIAQIIF